MEESVTIEFTLFLRRFVIYTPVGFLAVISVKRKYSVIEVIHYRLLYVPAASCVLFARIFNNTNDKLGFNALAQKIINIIIESDV